MKRVFLIVVLFAFTGCMPASQQEVLQLTNAVSQIVPAVKAAVSAESEETKAKVEDVLAKVETVNTAVATADDPMEAIQKGWDASKPFNPYYGYGVAILAALRLFQTSRTKKEVENKYAAMKIGVEKFRNENAAGKELYNIVGDARRAKGIT